MKKRLPWSAVCAVAVLTWAESALAVTSAELYSSESYQYGRFEARVRYAPGSGVVSSFFLWKDGSEIDGTYWNELDFEKLEADCHLETNAFFGEPEVAHTESAALSQDLCGEYHTYKYEWTPEYIAWFVDDVEIRRETDATAIAFAENATDGMQLRFNIWPGNVSFGGAFDPAILPVYQYIDWVQYSAYTDGNFEVEWREDFDGSAVPAGWLLGSWGSPKNLSTHSAQNFGVVDGYAVLALTADDAMGIEGAAPEGPPVANTSSSTSSTTGGATGDYGSGPSTCSLAHGSRGNPFGLGLLVGVAILSASRRRAVPNPSCSTSSKQASL